VGVDISFKTLAENYDAVVLAGGAEEARRLDIPGAEMPGVRLAMEFLTQQNKRVAGDDELRAAPRGSLTATGKHVVVIGGGDTGSDCVGTSNRQGAASVTQLEIMPKPPEKEDKALTWPDWPLKLRTSSSHQEGVERDWAVLTKRVIGDGEKVTGLECVRVEWKGGQMQEVAGSTFTIPADLILLAMGFTGPKKAGLLEQAGVALTGRGNVSADTDSYATSVPNVFACGDMRRGQSLVVWAIREGRQCARSVDEALMGATALPR
jgi:glutamate synthase (NADPH/NADH) small chain